MKLWVETDAENSVGRMVRAKASEMTAKINRQVASRATRAVQELRNAEIRVLDGQRSGRRYRRYPFKVKYTASAPGEPPARRTGALRLHWSGDTETRPHSNGVEVIAVLESGEKYAAALENGTSKMAPRPFIERIQAEALPQILRIYEASYN